MKTLKHLLSPRKIALGALAAIGLLALAGCVVTSVYPYYTAKDVAFEPRLLGRWVDSDSTNETNKYWEFARAGTNHYKLTIKNGDEVNEFQAHFFRLKAWTFLDAMPLERHGDCIPPHYLLKVSQVEAALEMTALNQKWLDELLEDRPGALRHIYTAGPDGERLVLTADTKDLQKFILKHVANTNAFKEAFSMRRQ